MIRYALFLGFLGLLPAAAGAQTPPTPEASGAAAADAEPELRDIYRIFQSARRLGTTRFKRILKEFRRLSEESEAEVRESVARQMELDGIIEKYKAAKDDKKGELRSKAAELLQKAFDEQQKRQERKAKMHREEAARLEQEVISRGKDRDKMIQKKLDQVLSEGAEDWEL